MSLYPSTSARLALEIVAPVASITLTHPPLNVIDLQMMDELRQAITQIAENRKLSAVVLKGAGRAFSAGVDVAAHTPDLVQSMLEKFHGLLMALVKLPQITIAQVHGTCLGGGAELAMMCDLCCTMPDAQWGFPEITLGCYPPVACAALSALVGQKKAAELIFTGSTFSGEDAAAWGLVNRAVSQEQMESAVREIVERLAKLSPAALAHAKKALYGWDSIHLDKGLGRAEKIYLEELMQTEDAREGIQAWMEKRQPRWKGR